MSSAATSRIRPVLVGGLMAGTLDIGAAAPVTLHEVIARFQPAKGAEDLSAMFVFGLIVAYCARYVGSGRRREPVAIGMMVKNASIPGSSRPE